MKNRVDFDKYNLQDNDVIVVAVSGGPDSMFLLNALIDYNPNLKLVVAHVNHNVRRQSVKDLQFVESFCNDFNLTFESMTIKEYSDDNFHNEARNIRYHFFETLFKKYEARCLMTAHHGDDLIETILMRLVRGSTLRGYAGFQEESYYNDMKIIRPLLTLTKEDIVKENRKYQIDSITDRSNLKDKYTRARYRKVMLPFLKKEDPNVHLKFLKYSVLLSDHNDYLEKLANIEKKDIYVDNILNIKKFNKEELVIKERIIFNILEEHYQDDLVLITDRHVNLILSLIASNNPNGEVHLPNDFLVKRSYEKLYFAKEVEQISNYEIEIIDEVVLPNQKTIKRIEKSDINDNNICRLSSFEIKLPLYVRTRKHGDKMELTNNKHTKIKKIFIDAKIPISERDMWPIVCDANNNIVWVPGLKKSKYCKQKNQTCDIILKCN